MEARIIYQKYKNIIVTVICFLILLIALIVVFENEKIIDKDVEEIGEKINEYVDVPSISNNASTDEIEYYLPVGFEVEENGRHVLLTKGDEAIELFYGNENEATDIILENTELSGEIIYEEVVENNESAEYTYLLLLDNDNLQFIHGNNRQYVVANFDVENFDKYLLNSYLIYNSVKEIKKIEINKEEENGFEDI